MAFLFRVGAHPRVTNKLKKITPDTLSRQSAEAAFGLYNSSKDFACTRVFGTEFLSCRQLRDLITKRVLASRTWDIHAVPHHMSPGLILLV